jgi:dihydroflavonol-4-reductase
LPFFTSGVTGFVDVRDVAKAMVILMESDTINERFIINSENLSFKTFFTMVAAELNKRAPFIRVNRMITELGWRANLMLCFFSGKAPAITKDTARSAQTISRYSAEKFSNRFNYQFIPVKEAVNHAGKWFKMLESGEI